MSEGKLGDAVEEYHQAVIGDSGNVRPWKALARTLLAYDLRRNPPPTDDDWDKLRHVLEDALERSPHDSELQLQMVELLVAREQVEKAGELLKQLCRKAPENVNFTTAMANFYARQGDFTRARRILDEAKASLGDLVAIRLAQGLVALREHGPQAGEELVRLADNTESFSPDERSQLWSGLLDGLIETKEYELAKQLCRKVGRQQPHNAVVRYRLFELRWRTRRPRSGRFAGRVGPRLDEIDGIAGRGPLWLYGKAVRLMLEAQEGKPGLLDAAMNYASQAQRCGSPGRGPT